MVYIQKIHWLFYGLELNFDGVVSSSRTLYLASDFEIARIVNSLKGSSLSDPECILTMVVKFVLPLIVSPLTKLINLSFENGIYPSSVKRAKMKHRIVKLIMNLYHCSLYLAKFLRTSCFLVLAKGLVLVENSGEQHCFSTGKRTSP